MNTRDYQTYVQAFKTFWSTLGKIANYLSESTNRLAERIENGLTWMARKVWKRYLNIETPLYKRWWKQNAADIQKQLNKLYPELTQTAKIA